MSAYVIGHLTVKDNDKWAEYRRQVPGTLEPWGGKVIFRGQRSGVLTGEHSHTNAAVIEFPDQEALRGWYGSEPYQALITLRNEAAEMVLVSYDGLTGFEAGHLGGNQAENLTLRCHCAIISRHKYHKTGII
jgi:uncharacterized protein (DUF1330 family)